jgi:hypothetical protein
MTVRRFGRGLLFVAASLFLGWFLDYLLWALAGFPYDCGNRDDCTALGEFLWNGSWPVFIGCVLVASAILWLMVTRRIGRRSLSEQDAHTDS